MDEQPQQTLTLATALERLEDMLPDSQQLRDLKSAAETAARWFRASPRDVPLDPVALRRLFKAVSPGGAGVTRKRIANVKWGLGRLLYLLGRSSRQAHKCQLTPEWDALTIAIRKDYDRLLLRRFGRYCSGRGVRPAQVTNELADEYRTSLECELRVAHPRRVQRETIRMWNRMAVHNAAWPQRRLTLPSYSPRYVLAWSELHPELVADIERFLSKKVTTDPFDLSRPLEALKQSSIATYRDRLRRFASCLVLTGTDVAELRSLADLVEMKAVVKGLRYLALERGRKPLAAAVATLLAIVARDHVGRPENVSAIAAIAQRLRGKRNGLSLKVRERLTPLKHEVNLARLFLLPTTLTRRLVRKTKPTKRDAQLFQRALALVLLTVCPLRIGSLCAIRIDRHLSWSAGPMKGDLAIEFSDGELKSGEPASFPIPREVAVLIQIYCSRFRPLLNPGRSPFLFCGRDPARPRDKGGFSTMLTRLTFERLGLRANPHLFRHVVHLIVLRRFPGAYAMVARVLTHRSIATTIQNYAHFDGELIMRAYQRMVDDVKEGGPHEPALDPAAVAYTFDRERPRHVGR